MPQRQAWEIGLAAACRKQGMFRSADARGTLEARSLCLSLAYAGWFRPLDTVSSCTPQEHLHAGDGIQAVGQIWAGAGRMKFGTCLCRGGTQTCVAAPMSLSGSKSVMTSAELRRSAISEEAIIPAMSCVHNMMRGGVPSHMQCVHPIQHRMPGCKQVHGLVLSDTAIGQLWWPWVL
eukprot:365763-Chlamydomonas_euryale.AAC.19